MLGAQKLLVVMLTVMQNQILYGEYAVYCYVQDDRMYKDACELV